MPTIWDVDEAERARLNPWLDPAFNTCGVPLNEGLLPDDIPERVGLPVDNVSIEVNEITGMNFLKLEDTPDSYSGDDKKYVQVQGQQLGFDKITIPTVGEDDLVYLDKFRDSSIHWTWMQWKGASAAGKSIIETDRSVELGVTSGTHADWSTTANEAPKLIIGLIGFPCEIIVHLKDWTDTDLTRAGIFVSYNATGYGSDTAIFFHRIRVDATPKDGLQVWRVGSAEQAYVAWPADSAWFRIRLGFAHKGASNMVFSYGSDGDTWTDLYTLPQGTPASGQWPTAVAVITTGIFVQNWAATYAPVTAYFDHFEMRRHLGPDGG